ncbi:MAG: O-antigen ligase family protein [Chloroflexota bacterium]|nr:O-antigen ligase family protein [Chloroflexota bacterium]
MIATRPTASWLPLAALLAALGVGFIAFLGPLAGLALLAPLAAAFVLLFPPLAVPLLIVASSVNRFGIAWGDAQIRVEILIVLLLAAVIANQIAVRTLPWRALRSPLLVPLLGYLLINVLASLLFAVERSRGLKLDAEIFAAVACYIVASALLWRRENLALAIRALWVVSTLEAVIGIASMVLFAAHVTLLGVQINESGFPMAYGTQWEANIFGSFLLGNFLVLLGDYVNGNRSSLRAFSLMLIVLGIGVSMTRTVWLALVIALVVFVALAQRLRRSESSLLGILAAIPVVALVGLIVGSATPLAGRLMDLVNLQSSSASGRFVWFTAALQDWKSHPIFGNGTGSFNYNAVPGQPHPWLPNLFLLTLHDTGIVGLAIVVALIVIFFRTIVRGLRLDNNQALLAAGAAAGFTGLLLAFQMTSGFWFAYPWIVAAIGMRASEPRPEGS